MTLILNHSNRFGWVNVSDRITSVGQATASRRFNKILVVATTDALVSVGFTGIAELDGLFTDEWLAEKLASDFDPRVFQRFRPNPYVRTLNSLQSKIFTSIQDALRKEIIRKGDYLEIMISGQRWYRRKIIPFILIIEKPTGSRNIRYNTVKKNRFFFDPSGCCSYASGGYQTAEPKFFQNLFRRVNSLAHSQPLLMRISTVLAGGIKTLASKHHGIGEATMRIVSSMSENRTDVYFDPVGPDQNFKALTQVFGVRKASFTPIIITPNILMPPQESIGVPPPVHLIKYLDVWHKLTFHSQQKGGPMAMFSLDRGTRRPNRQL